MGSIASGAGHPLRHGGRWIGCVFAACLALPVLAQEAAHDAAHDDAPLVLASLNQRVNHQVAYADDRSTWGRIDRWSTPAELQARGAGDCEDFAIAKYFSLVASGLPASQLRIAYVELLAVVPGGLSARHMVLVWLPAGDAPGGELVLDNLLDAVRPLSARADLHVLISFNAEGIWSGVERGPPARPARQIIEWARVMDRVAAQPTERDAGW